MYILDFLASKEGDIWGRRDTDEVMRVLREV